MIFPLEKAPIHLGVKDEINSFSISKSAEKLEF
jgi:hypothetical protein